MYTSQVRLDAVLNDFFALPLGHLSMGLVRPGTLGYHGKLTGPRIFLVLPTQAGTTSLG